MSNIDHQSVVGSNDAGVVLRPNVRNQGHLDHISADFVPTAVKLGQEAQCTLSFAEPNGTHGAITDLYLSFNAGYDVAMAEITQFCSTNLLNSIEKLSIENEGTVIFEINGRGLLSAVIKDSVLAQAQHQSDECFVDHWLFHRCNLDTTMVVIFNATHQPVMRDLGIPLNMLTDNMFKKFKCSRLSGITFVLKLISPLANSANLQESRLLARANVGTASLRLIRASTGSCLSYHSKRKRP